MFYLYFSSKKTPDTNGTPQADSSPGTDSSYVSIILLICHTKPFFKRQLENYDT